jgi:hypothetical protein
MQHAADRISTSLHLKRRNANEADQPYDVNAGTY